KLTLDSGPPFTMGDIEIQGLNRYPEHVVRRVVDLKPDEPYSSERLLKLQRALQAGPWFSSVVVDIERDREHPKTGPAAVTVSERPRQDVGLSVGYGTDDGARIEAAYRHRNLLDRGFDLQSSLRIAQERQIGYVDVYMPPGIVGTRWFGSVPYRDSFGVLAE